MNGAQRATALCAVLAIALLAMVGGAGFARADVFGQLDSWGTPPSSPIQEGRPADQFYQASAFGLDPVDDSVYVLDFKNATRTVFRLQKFDQAGTPLGSTTFPRLNANTNVYGIAVDHTLGRVYLLQATKGLDSSNANRYVATKLLVYSTAPTEGGELTFAAGVPSGELSLPSTFPSTQPIEQPDPPAIDPITHDVLISGLSSSTTTTHVLVRFGQAGLELDRFTDSAGVITARSSTRNSLGSVVSPDGEEIYLGVGSTNFNADVYELPASLDSIASLDGSDGRPLLKQAGVGTGTHVTTGGFGPQLAISPDGEVLYISDIAKNGTTGNEGNVWVRGLSLADGSTRILYGGGQTGVLEGGTCRITWSSPAFAVDDAGALFAFDYGITLGGAAIATFGDQVLKFGSGGGGCPNPSLQLKVNDSSSTITVEKGDQVTLDASDSEFADRVPTDATWKWSGPESSSQTSTPPPAPLTFSRRFLEAGTYVLDFSVLATGPIVQDSGSAERASWSVVPKTLIVRGATPLARFIPSATTTPSGVPVSFDAGDSEDPRGGTCSQEDGCAPTHSLAGYRWEFDDGSGSPEVVVCDGDGDPAACDGDEVSESFENTGSAPKQVTVRLKVTSNDNEQSGPYDSESEKQITVNPATPDPELSVGANPGDGQGTVVSDPEGIDCPAACSKTFAADTVVTLEAKPTPGTHSFFAGWSTPAGGCTVTTNPCQVTMDQSRSLTARFDLTRFKLTVSKSNPAGGTVSGGSAAEPGTIDCGSGSGCEHQYVEGAQVTLTRSTTSPGFEFKEWAPAGACDSEPGGNCVVSMNAARSVQAVFVIPAPTAHNEAEGGVGQTSVAMRGTVDNRGAVEGSSCIFEVALASDPGFSSPVATPACTPAKITGTGPKAVSANAFNLKPGTAYLYRVKATSNGGSAVGTPAEAFTTAADSPPAGGGGGGGSTDGAQQQQPSGGSDAGTGGARQGTTEKGATPAQRRKAAIARCRKLKAAKARTKCLRKARQIGKHKKHKRHRSSPRLALSSPFAW
ncbi:MAG TPA: hypothetical protein VG898_03235 [Solirubrobacterales bacterium]|nr:hypothetical protein [Solirubrobacterales bacterium]